MANIGKNIPITYDKKADMIADPNLVVEGQVARTLGLVYLGDGLGSYYKLMNGRDDPTIAENYAESRSSFNPDLYFVPVKIDVSSESFDAIEASYTEILTTVQSVRNDLSGSISSLDSSVNGRIDTLSNKHTSDVQTLTSSIGSVADRVAALEQTDEETGSNVEEVASALQTHKDNYIAFKDATTETLNELAGEDDRIEEELGNRIDQLSTNLDTQIGNIRNYIDQYTAQDPYDVKKTNSFPNTGLEYTEFYGGDKKLTFNPEQLDAEYTTDVRIDDDSYFNTSIEGSSAVFKMGYEGFKYLLPAQVRLEDTLEKDYEYNNGDFVFSIAEEEVENPDYVAPEDPIPTDPTPTDSGSETTNPDSGTSDPDSGNTNPDSGSTDPDSGDTTEPTNPDSGETNPDNTEEPVNSDNENTDETNPDAGTEPTTGDEGGTTEETIPEFITVKLITLTVSNTDEIIKVVYR